MSRAAEAPPRDENGIGLMALDKPGHPFRLIGDRSHRYGLIDSSTMYLDVCQVDKHVGISPVTRKNGVAHRPLSPGFPLQDIRLDMVSSSSPPMGGRAFVRLDRTPSLSGPRRSETLAGLHMVAFVVLCFIDQTSRIL